MKRVIVMIALSLVVFFFIDMGSANTETLHWGIPAAKDEKVPYPGKKYDEILTKYGSYYIGNPTKKEVYLTFDTGYKDDQTAKILDVLDQHNIKATFFVTGGFLRYNEDLVLRMVNSGHIVANHTNSHPNIAKLSNEELANELAAVENRYYKITQKEMMRFFRPPEGVFTEEKLKFLQENHYTTVFWSVAYIDWVNDRSSDYAYRRVISRIHPGAIVLLHTISEDNANALEKIIDDLTAKGYTFYTVANLITDQVDAKAQ